MDRGRQRLLCGVARLAATAAQLERTVRAYWRVTTEGARELREQAHLSVFWNPDGSLELHGRLAPEDGALLLRALDAMRDSLWNQARGCAEPRPARQASNAEALLAVAEAALAQPDASRRAGSATRWLFTPTRAFSLARARAAASSRTAARWPRRPRAGSPATRPPSEGERLDLELAVDAVRYALAPTS